MDFFLTLTLLGCGIHLFLSVCVKGQRGFMEEMTSKAESEG